MNFSVFCINGAGRFLPLMAMAAKNINMIKKVFIQAIRELNLHGPSLRSPTVLAKVLSLSLEAKPDGPAMESLESWTRRIGKDPRAVPCFSYTINRD